MPATGAGPFTVRVDIRPTDRCGCHRLAHRGGEPCQCWTLWSVTFPRLTRLTPSAEREADRLFFPQGWGTELVGWSKMVDAAPPLPSRVGFRHATARAIRANGAHPLAGDA